MTNKKFLKTFYFRLIFSFTVLSLIFFLYSCSNQLSVNDDINKEKEITLNFESSIIEPPKNLQVEWLVEDNAIKLSWEYSADNTAFKVYKEIKVEGKPYYILLGETSEKNFSVKFPSKDLEDFTGFGVSAKLNDKESHITVLSGKEIKIISREGNLIWSKEIPAGFGSMAFDEGIIYATVLKDDLNASTNVSDFLYAIDGLTGRILWKKELPGRLSMPVIDDYGVIYLKSTEGVVYAFTKDGEELWKLNLSEEENPLKRFQLFLALGNDNTVYAAEKNRLYKIDKSGNVLKKFDLENSIAWIVADSNGIIYTTGEVAAIDMEKCEKKWKFDFGMPADATISIGIDGTIYLGASGGVGAIESESGRIKWVYLIEEELRSHQTRIPTSIGSDGTIYLTLFDGTVRAIDPGDGIEKWRKKVSDTWITSSPVIGDDGKIYVATCDGKIVCLNSDGEICWELKTGILYILSTPVLSDDGVIYACTISNVGTSFPPSRGFICAIKTSSKGLAKLGWPRFQGDNRNTGRQLK